jgi:hypothetical protein
MDAVNAPQSNWREKLKRFFLLDLLKGLRLTFAYNVGALTDKTPLRAKAFTRSSIRRCAQKLRRVFMARRV